MENPTETNLRKTLKIFPFQWNGTTTTFTACHLPSWRRIQYLIALCFIFIDICYVIYRLCYLGTRYYHWDDGSIKLEEIVILFSLIGPKTMALLFSLTILVNVDDIMEFLNESLKIAARKKNVRDSATVKVLVLAFLLRIMQLVLVSIVQPNKSQFWYSALPPNLKTTGIFWVHFYFTLQVSLIQFVVVFFIIILIVYYVSLDVVLTKKRNSTITNKIRTYRIYSRIGDQPKLFERGQKLLFAPSLNSRTCQDDITRKYLKSCKAMSLLGIQKIFFPQILKFIVFNTIRLLIATD
ncbi:unnamed protein product [Allacma fusca]|uniref:Uncharacterized protein n=1 Tax=Allacma fusca TaxID=39272 RepID=A0A8J2L4M0_9HEXA|nr:unnamed protein product [Allacma fusca]